jgi:peptide deformylase
VSLPRIYIAPDKVLREVSDEVGEDEFGEDLDSFLETMISVMNENNGIGLAAIQIGVKKRIIVANIDNEPIAMINPEVLSVGELTSKVVEGCLSVPTVLEEIERSSSVIVKYMDRGANYVEKEFKGLSSHIVQHEIDHLDGKTILDKISRLKRDIYKRKVNKLRRKLKRYLL